MSYTRVNPYITLDELREELKMSTEDIEAGSTTEEDLLRAIDNASRWVDNYTRRDFFFHDHTVTPMTFDQHDMGIFDYTIYPRHVPIIAVSEIKLNGETLEADKYAVKNYDPNNQTILSVSGKWFRTSWSGSSNRQLVEIYGTFGYLQNTSHPVTIAGDTAGQLSGFSLTGTLPATLYWALSEPETDVALLRLYSDSGHTTLVAEGKTAVGGTAINLWPMNGSGISGTGNIALTGADDDVANTFTPGAGVYSSAMVPLNIPGHIKLAVRMVAAAISGRNKKEIIDLAGSKQSIATSDIPKAVFQMLGKQSPILT